MELDKRDRLIGKYEKYYRQLKRDAERRETEKRGTEYKDNPAAPSSASPPKPYPSNQSANKNTPGGTNSTYTSGFEDPGSSNSRSSSSTLLEIRTLLVVRTRPENVRS